MNRVLFVLGGAAGLGLLALALRPHTTLTLLPTRLAREETPREVALPSPPARILFVGDIMLDRIVRSRMEASALEYAYPFAYASSVLRDADLTVGNLEGPVIGNATQTAITSLSFAFTPRALPALHEAGFDAFTIANNHTFDRRDAGFSETESFLKEAGFGYFGHPVRAGAGETFRTEIHSRSIVLLGFNATYPSFVLKDAEERVRLERDSLPNTLLFAVIHWGDEYELTANEFQQRVGRAFIDAGADAVIGHHPHVVQDLEFYRGKLIAYSLGNFVFDQDFSDETQKGLGVLAEIGSSTVAYRLLPFSIKRSQPVLMDDVQRDVFLSALAERSGAELYEGILRGIVTGEL